MSIEQSALVCLMLRHILCFQVTFEQHKENLSHMFRQYQHQESTGSQGTIRTISGVSQSSETTECVNGPPAEETAPSTVIELTVDELSQNSPDSASSSTITSSPQEAGDRREETSITVSNILAGADEDELEQVDETSRDGSNVGNGNASEDTVIQKNSTEEQSEVNEPKAQAETLTDKSDDHQVKTLSNQPVEMAIDSTSDHAQTPITEDEKSDKAKSLNSTTEDSLNEGDTENPEHEVKTETAPSLENSVLGGASIFNEDLVDVSSVSDQIHPSDADESQEESSYVSAAAGEEAEVADKDEDKQEAKESEKNDQKEQELNTEEDKDQKQEVRVQENNEESDVVEKQVPCVKVPTDEAAEQNVTEAPKEEAEPCTSITETAITDQQSSDNTPPTTTASDSTSLSQPSETGGATGDDAPSGAQDNSSTAPGSDSRRSTDSSKTNEIKIARLDVSNVALDTERLELKEASTTVCIFRLFSMYI